MFYKLPRYQTNYKLLFHIQSLSLGKESTQKLKLL